MLYQPPVIIAYVQPKPVKPVAKVQFDGKPMFELTGKRNRKQRSW